MADDREIKGAGIFHGPPHDFTIVNRPTVIAHRNTTGFAQFAHFRKRFTLETFGDGPDRKNIGQFCFGGPLKDVVSYRLVIVDGVGIRHTGYGSEATRHRSLDAGLNVFLIFITGFPEMNMDIDQPRNHQPVCRVEYLSIARI